MATHLMIQGVTNKDQQQRLVEELTGPYRTMGAVAADPELANAPTWWRGEEDAYETTMASLGRIPRRGRSRR